MRARGNFWWLHLQEKKQSELDPNYEDFIFKLTYCEYTTSISIKLSQAGVSRVTRSSTKISVMMETKIIYN